MAKEAAHFVLKVNPGEGGSQVLLAQPCILEKKDEKEHERFIVVTEMRLFLVKSKLIGLGVDQSVLLSQVLGVSVMKTTLEISYETMIEKEPTKVILIACHKDQDINILAAGIVGALSLLQHSLFFNFLSNVSVQSNQSMSEKGKFILAYKHQSAKNRRGMIAEIVRTIEKMDFLEKERDVDNTLDLAYLVGLSPRAKKGVDHQLLCILLASVEKLTKFSAICFDRLSPMCDESVAQSLASLLMKNQSFTKVSVRGCNISVGFMQSFYKCLNRRVSLEELNLSHNAIDSAHFENLDSTRFQTKSLILHQSALTSAALKAITNLLVTKDWMTELNTLDISANNFGSDKHIAQITQTISHYLKTTKELTTINLTNCALPLTCLLDLAENKALITSNLRSLKVGGNEMTVYGAKGLFGILSMATSIQFLSLEDIDPIPDAFLTEIISGCFENKGFAIKKQRPIIDLSMHRPASEDRPQIILSTFEALAKAEKKSGYLKGFRLLNNNLGGPIFNQWCGYMGSLRGIEHLALDCNFERSRMKKYQIKSFADNIACLAELIGSLKLKLLSLCGDSDEKRKAYLNVQDLLPLFAALSTNTTLTNLYLDFNHIDDKGCVPIADMIASNNCLEIVSIENNRITHKGVTTLAKAITPKTNLISIFPVSALKETQSKMNKKNFAAFRESISDSFKILKMNAIRTKNEHDRIPDGEPKRRDSHVRNLIGMMEGKKLISNYNYSRTRPADSVSIQRSDSQMASQRASPFVLIGANTSNYRSGMKVEEKTSVEAKLSAPAPIANRRKRKRKKIDV